ncbi:hypothetical protein A6M27_11160 [Acidithiobacillus thiooxidans]|uniref:Uncharacterized protein n=1 Tax=Acidithiobacillus thiooxidans TaxID=930 RepID=A0A1C2IYQ7_ACITH|nr:MULTISPECIES: hypothetical protein [Acidithiobacillus]MDA8175701.1 hypothetical protein [Acidithiobacillus sp.]OCX72206.1 hypothetical protein A6P07_10480 [Acidithiobacillus thiooxidans]OCX72898.1 hypothetical protein A6M23_08930 [Acidithiobacillus thiooxidans]OCX73397.1 hypothetical protein A6O24_11525 [Acidithiobacillus thiooxidans]OCX80724.1 hypothetical protein A6O26_14300 [Acidithiobacillus thiooxidans]
MTEQDKQELLKINKIVFVVYVVVLFSYCGSYFFMPHWNWIFIGAGLGAIFGIVFLLTSPFFKDFH